MAKVNQYIAYVEKANHHFIDLVSHAI